MNLVQLRLRIVENLYFPEVACDDYTNLCASVKKQTRWLFIRSVIVFVPADLGSTSPRHAGVFFKSLIVHRFKKPFMP
jgi:hypothetical protein